MPSDRLATPKSTPHWFKLSPDRLFVALLAIEGALLASERFQWFAFNEKKGWTVLIAVAAVGLFLLFVFLGFTFALLFHWRFQFGIRSLLVLTVAVAIVGSWLAMEMQRAEKQRKAVAALRESDNHVYYDYQWNDSGARILPGPAWLIYLLGDDFFLNVTFIYFGKTVTNVELELLSGMNQVRYLFLCDTSITDAGLEILNRIQHPVMLELGNTQITDAGLSYLKGQNQLQMLNLSETQITDAGLKHLEVLDNLYSLSLEKTQVTDAGLEHLKGVKQLCTIWLLQTQVTDNGVDKLKKALPKLHILSR